MTPNSNGIGAGRGVAVVTGGASGIGEACVRQLAAAGHPVAVLDVNADGARRVAASLDGPATDWHCDVTDTAALFDLTARIETEAGAAIQARIDAGVSDPAVFRSSSALKSLVYPDDVAEAVTFLCSDAVGRVLMRIAFIDPLSGPFAR